MKRVLWFFVLMAALSLAACSGEPEKKAEGQTEPEKKTEATAESGERLLKLAMDSDPVTLDPHVQLSGSMLQYSHLVYDPLIRWDQEMQFEPRLAERWERLDPLTVRFYLRKGVKFHSGNEMTAADVKWTIERLKRSSEYKGLFDPFVGGVVVDDYTVDIKTKVPYPLLLNMATYIFPMDSKFYSGTDDKNQDKGFISKTDYSFANINQSGTGAFYVESRDPGQKWVLKRFKDYWSKDKTGNIDTIELLPIKEDATRVAALLSGDVDFIMPVPPQDYQRIEETKGVDLIQMPGTRIILLQMNQEKQPVFKDKRVRQAIIYAIDNPGIVKKIMKGQATAAAQQSPKGYDGHNPELTPRYDLEKAKKLMEEAGYGPDKMLEITIGAPNNRYVNDEKIAEAVTGMLSKIYIKGTLTTMPKAQYWDAFDAHTWDMQLIGWHSDTEDSANFTEYLAMCVNKETGYGQYNSGMYCNAEVDELITKCLSETDLKKRSEMLKKVERILYDDAAFVPLHWQMLSWAGADKLLNAEKIVNVMNFPYFNDLSMK